MNEIKQVLAETIATSAMLVSAFLHPGGTPAAGSLAAPVRADSLPYFARAVRADSAVETDAVLRSVRPASTLGLTLSSRLLSQEDHADPEAPKPDHAQKAPGTAAYPLTGAERDLVERVIMTSCGSLRNLQMATANAQVVLDRVKSGRFGATVTAVLTAPHQFEVPWKGTVNDVVKEAVQAVFDRGERVIDQPVYYYLNPHDAEVLKKTWAKDKVYVTTIGTGHFVHQYWTSK